MTEHRAEIKACEQCGERLKAYAVYIKNYGLLSFARAAELFEDLFCVPLSAGTLVTIDRGCAERLEEVEKRIKKNILGSHVVQFDETGMRVEGNWKSYFTYGCEHALCNAHHIRELNFIFEHYGQKWAQEMKEILLEIKG